jgi:3-oxoacyl-[acyl-carrier-protein] synthase II
MNRERVVVTGIGVVSSVGTGKEEFWDGIKAGRSGVRAIEGIDPQRLPQSKIAAQILDFDPHKYMDPKQAKRMDRFVQFGVAASKMAKEDANLDIEATDPTRVGVVVGSAAGGFATIETQHLALIEKGPGRVSPFTVPMLIVNMAAGWVSILNNAKGPNSCTVTACATSANSIGDAARIIQRGEADVMFAGGTDAPITSLCMAAFGAARTLSTRNDNPQAASRPFDKDRDGFVMGEGACVLILESLTHARKRGAKIYAEFVGYGQTGDAFDIVQPRSDGEGAGRAMQIALEDAKLQSTEVDYINAHGTSTPLGDRAETQAVKRIFGEHATSHKLKVSSTKSMTGHLLGAAGALEAAVCVLAISDSVIPPTINIDNLDPECDLDYVANKAITNTAVNVAMSNSFGFGGHNACLIFKKLTD